MFRINLHISDLDLQPVLCYNELTALALFYSVTTTKQVVGLQLYVQTAIHKAVKQYCQHFIEWSIAASCQAAHCKVIRGWVSLCSHCQ